MIENKTFKKKGYKDKSAQLKNKEWWQKNPMNYNWNEEKKNISSISLKDIKDIDNNFFEIARDFAHPNYPNEKYFNAYFTKYENIWHHGDFATTTEKDGYIIYGRSDATLNSGGVRIGTSELYRVVENIENIEECLAAELNLKNDTKVILFIKLFENIKLDEKFINRIKNEIKRLLSPKHIPSKIISVSE